MKTPNKKEKNSVMVNEKSSNEKSNEEMELVNRALKGDSAAGSEIVMRHQQNVYNLGLRFGGNQAEAECILQETFLKVFEKLEKFRGDSKLGTWIHRVATNVALMRIRSKKNKYYVPIEEEPNDDESYDLGFIVKSLDKTPLENTLNEELKEHLQNAISSLPENLGAAFILKDIEGLSMAEIARRLGKTVPAIKADLHRGRVKLRNELAEFVSEGFRER